MSSSAPAPQRIVALIPARGGSVSIPKKNIKPLAGRPLIDWVIQPALDSGIFTEVWVSTDDDTIAETAISCGAKVHRRAAETATNTASTESAMVDFVSAHPDYDVLCLIQATSPLLTPSDFTGALRAMRKAGADSLVTAVRAHRFLWSVDASGIASAKNYDPTRRPRRQDWDGELIENGAFYFTTKAIMEGTGCRLGGKISLYEMEEHTLTELDSLVDWLIVSHMVEQYGYFPANGPSSRLAALAAASSTAVSSNPLGRAPSWAVAAAALAAGLAGGALIARRLA